MSVVRTGQTKRFEPDDLGFSVRHPAQLWMQLSAAALILALLYGYGAFETLYRLQPQKYVALQLLLVVPALVLSPRASIQRIFLPIPFILFVSWWMASYSWSAFRPAFLPRTADVLTNILVVIIFARLLPIGYFLRTVVNAGYIAIGLIGVTLVLKPSSRVVRLHRPGQYRRRATRRIHPQELHGAVPHLHGRARAVLRTPPMAADTDGRRIVAAARPGQVGNRAVHDAGHAGAVVGPDAVRLRGCRAEALLQRHHRRPGVGHPRCRVRGTGADPEAVQQGRVVFRTGAVVGGGHQGHRAAPNSRVRMGRGLHRLLSRAHLVVSSRHRVPSFSQPQRARSNCSSASASSVSCST